MARGYPVDRIDATARLFDCTRTSRVVRLDIFPADPPSWARWTEHRSTRAQVGLGTATMPTRIRARRRVSLPCSSLTMIIATWNLERGGRTRAARAAREDVLRELAADVVVLTEPPAEYRSARGIVASPPLREDAGSRESWVAIVGSTVEPGALEIPTTAWRWRREPRSAVQP